jgi:serine/threonine protein kinase
LKPENIFVDSNFQVKIGDLGFARDNPQGANLATICGTLYYTPPEMVRRDLYDGQKADIWAVGIIAYVMAVSALPWKSIDQAGIAEEILAGEITLPPDFPDPLKVVISLCTRLDPTQRPTATELLELAWMKDERKIYERSTARGMSSGAISRPLVDATIYGTLGSHRRVCHRDGAKKIRIKPIRVVNSETLRSGKFFLHLKESTS